MRLIDYFKADSLKPALLAFAEFASAWKWSIAERTCLYRLAEIAFNPEGGDQERRRSFDDLYNWLKSYWKVFRNSSEYWTATQVYDVLTFECRDCGRPNGTSLLNLASAGCRDALMQCLTAMQGVKTLRSGSVFLVAVSKFLHFYNPALFPILDDAVIQKQVLATFRERIVVSEPRLDMLHPVLREY